MTRLFVYGSLKRGGQNHSFLAEQKFIGAARTGSGFALYSLGEFPGMVVDATATEGVTGEVWEVDDRCLAELDRLEGVDEKLYERKSIALTGEAGGKAETYLYLRSVDGRARLGPTWEIG